MKIAVVVPTCRPERIETWRDLWADEIAQVGASLYVVHDNKDTWAQFYDEYREPSWIFTQQGAGIRCYGFLKALKDGADVIVTLDDDVVPEEGQSVLAQHVRNLTEPRKEEAWWEVAYDNVRTRGLPFKELDRDIRVVISHGLWTGTPDLDAPTQLVMPWAQLDANVWHELVPTGKYFAMSGMNLAFTKEIAPAMYFPLMGPQEPYDRFDDIWCGIVAKRVCDQLHLGCVSGAPFVRHDRASDPFKNLIKEATGIQENERFWKVIDNVSMSGSNPDLAIRVIAYHLALELNPYYKRHAKALLHWCDMVQEATK